MNCHLKFRIIPPETACNYLLAASHKPEVLKLVWDEQGRGECCNGFNIIPEVIWWDFHPGWLCQAQSSCADSHCALPLLCADTEPASPSAAASTTSRFKWLNPLAWFAKSSWGSFHSLFSGAPFPVSSWQTPFPLLVHYVSLALPLRVAKCHSFGFLGFFNGIIFFTSLGIFSSSFWAAGLVSIS